MDTLRIMDPDEGDVLDAIGRYALTADRYRSGSDDILAAEIIRPDTEGVEYSANRVAAVFYKI